MEEKRKRLKYLPIRAFLSVVILIIGFFFALSDRYFDTDYNKVGNLSDIDRLTVQNGDVLEQSVTFYLDRVHSISVCTVNRTKNSHGNIQLQLIDGAGTIIWSQKVDVSQLKPQKIKWFRVLQNVVVGDEYTFRISTDELYGTIQLAGIALENNMRGIIDGMSVNSQKQDTTLLLQTAFSQRLDRTGKFMILLWSIVFVCYILSFEVLFSSKESGLITIFVTLILLAFSAYFSLKIEFAKFANYVLFAAVFFTIAVALIGLITLILKRETRVELFFALSVTTFGLLYSIVLTPFSAPDEQIHFVSAYRLSNAIMGQPVNDETGKVYMRQCDVKEYERFPGNEYSIECIKQLINFENEESQAIVVSDTSLIQSSPILMYMPQALGITFARLVHANYFQLVYMGRFANMLVFVLITYMAIKVMPRGKWILFSICHIPLVMEVISSYSYDTVVLAGTFFLVAYILQLLEQEKAISVKQLVPLAVLCMIYAPLKPTYIPLVGLVFVIPNCKFNSISWKSVSYKLGFLLLAIISTLVVYKGSVFLVGSLTNDIVKKNTLEEMTDDDSMILSEDEEIQISNRDHYLFPNVDFIMENPFDIVESFIESILDFTDEFLLTMFGHKLSWYNIDTPVYLTIMVMVLFYMSFVFEDNDMLGQMTVYKRLWICLIIFGTVCAVLLTFYLKCTAPSAKNIAGVQGRYFIPVLAPTVFFLQGRHKRKSQTYCSLVMLAALIQTVSLLNICSIVWSR